MSVFETGNVQNKSLTVFLRKRYNHSESR